MKTISCAGAAPIWPARVLSWRFTASSGGSLPDWIIRAGQTIFAAQSATSSVERDGRHFCTEARLASALDDSVSASTAYAVAASDIKRPTLLHGACHLFSERALQNPSCPRTQEPPWPC